MIKDAHFIRVLLSAGYDLRPQIPPVMEPMALRVHFNCIDSLMNLMGSKFTCMPFLGWIRNHNPASFVIETWHTEDQYTWQLISKTKLTGVKWGEGRCSQDGEMTPCCGIIDCEFQDKIVEEVKDGHLILIDRTEKYPSIVLSDKLAELPIVEENVIFD